MITIMGRPISKKNNKRAFRHVVLSSVAFLKFEKSALEQLKTQMERYGGDVDVSYVFTYKGKLWTDADNAIAGINDILQKAGVLEDDKQIKSGTFIVHSGKDWKTEISISPLATIRSSIFEDTGRKWKEVKHG